MPAGKEIPWVIYADGSCIVNPGPGGWAAIIDGPQGRCELWGSHPSTTNNRMEITAAIEALKRTAPGARVLLRSDSQYLVKTINLAWKRRQNRELWAQLDAELAGRRVTLEWVRGHAGDPLNSRADELARAAAAGSAHPDNTAARGASTPPGQPPSTGASAAQLALSPACARQERPGQTEWQCQGPAGPQIARTPEETRRIARLQPMLGAQETVARCLSCKELFVAVNAATYCQRLSCQIQARRTGRG